jgi:hypothetical protein
LQFGGGDKICVNVDKVTVQFPTKYDGVDYFAWNAAENVAGVKFYPKSGDVVKFTNCLFTSPSAYRWEFDASMASSGFTLDFSGTTVVGATVTLQAASDLDSVTFNACPSFTQNGATLTNCAFVNTKVSSASPANAALISDCTFTKTTGTQHGIEISGTAADFTLTNVTFTGYAGVDGSSGNEAIYVNIASGTVTITISGGSTPSIRTAGATVVLIVNPVTVAVNVKDNDGANLQNARVLLKAAAGGPFPFDVTVTVTRSGSIATVSHTAHGMQTNDKVVITGADQPEYDGVFTITVTGTNAYTYTVSGTPVTPATGTVKATYAALHGLTDASGNISTTRVYSSDQPVSGWVRKASTAPYFRTFTLGGTVDSDSGYSTSIQMILDQ